ncbi:MAG: hypothetical protein KAT32_00995 [Candidatus Moranbacteria bacterium]|nr:hypothetical protein [Candidatus Moranbacteria bacterium]
MKHVKASIHDRDKYRKKLTFLYDQEIPNIDLEAKVRNKYNTPIEDVYIDYYYSPNKWFSKNHDKLLGTDKISKIKGKKSVEKHLREIDISSLEIGNHYFFIDIRYTGGHNISSRNDKTEFVKISIIGEIEPEIPSIEPDSDGSFPVYRYEDLDYGNIRYSLNYISNHVAWNAFAEQQLDTTPVYELWSGYHFFYVTGEEVRQELMNDRGWEYLGIAFYVYDQLYSGTMPVYRIYDNDTGEHLYTADDQEKDQWMSVGDKRVDGPGFWVPIQP